MIGTPIKPPLRERGMAMVAALFLLVVLATLGVVAVRLSAVQHHTVSLTIQAARAFQAAQSGIEYAGYRALVAGSCSNTSFTYSEGGLAGITVDVSCAASAHGEGAGITNIYALQAFASSGLYGTPDYVSRRIQATVTDSP